MGRFWDVEPLDSMLSVCSVQQSGPLGVQANYAVERIRDEIARREAQENEEIRKSEAQEAERKAEERQSPAMQSSI